MTASSTNKSFLEKDSYMNLNTPATNLQFIYGIFWEKPKELEDST